MILAGKKCSHKERWFRSHTLQSLNWPLHAHALYEHILACIWALWIVHSPYFQLPVHSEIFCRFRALQSSNVTREHGTTDRNHSLVHSSRANNRIRSKGWRMKRGSLQQHRLFQIRSKETSCCASQCFPIWKPFWNSIQYSENSINIGSFNAHWFQIRNFSYRSKLFNYLHSWLSTVILNLKRCMLMNKQFLFNRKSLPALRLSFTGNLHQILVSTRKKMLHYRLYWVVFIWTGGMLEDVNPHLSWWLWKGIVCHLEKVTAFITCRLI